MTLSPKKVWFVCRRSHFSDGSSNNFSVKEFGYTRSHLSRHTKYQHHERHLRGTYCSVMTSRHFSSWFFFFPQQRTDISYYKSIIFGFAASMMHRSLPQYEMWQTKFSIDNTRVRLLLKLSFYPHIVPWQSTFLFLFSFPNENFRREAFGFLPVGIQQELTRWLLH